MAIKATVIEDSISPAGHRLTTLELVFPRFILAEVNTYRMWSRSASSSRAIPLSRRIEEVRINPAIPVEWGKNQRGMVADEVLPLEDELEAYNVWIEAANAAADYASYLGELKLHKQVAARILEPFLWQTMVVSSTDFQNMFNQRIHRDAQPEFRELALRMKEALKESTPRELNVGEFHLPYVTAEEREEFDKLTLLAFAVSRAAKTSYGNQGKIDATKDIDLFQRLLFAEPPHWAPFEHVATPTFHYPVLGNFEGWEQLRHMTYALNELKQRFQSH